MSKGPTGRDTPLTETVALHGRTYSGDTPQAGVIPGGFHQPPTVPDTQATEIPLADNASRRPRDRYTDISEFSPVGYLMLSRMGVIEKVNSNTATLFGVDFKDLLQRRFEHFVMPEYLDKWHRHFESMIKQDSPKNVELVLKRSPAAVFHARLEFQGTATYEKSSVIRITLTDITERRLAEQESLRLLHRNQMLMNTSLDGIHVMDIQGNLLEANDSFCNMLGYTQEEMAHLHVADWDAKLTSEELRWAFKETIDKSTVIETLHRRKDGALINVEISVSGKRIDDRDYIFASSRDITERKRIASSLEETTRELRELVAQHGSSLEEERKSIAREVHDELGQILTSLRMNISVLRIRFGKDNDELMKMVQNMTELADRAIHGVRNVAENLRPVALDIGIVSAVEWLCNNFTAHSGIPCSLSSPDEFIDLDNSRAIVLFRIVQESLTNVTRHADANSVAITISMNDDNLHLEVRDDGKGFCKNTPGKRKSYGLLGMNERALTLGGTVNIASSAGDGTVVSVCIPMNFGEDAQ